MYCARNGTSICSSFSIAITYAWLVAHHRHVVEAVHVRHGLDEGARFGKLLSGPVQQSDVRIGALDHFAVEFEHQAQHAVGRRVLRAEIERVILDFSHGRRSDVFSAALRYTLNFVGG